MGGILITVDSLFAISVGDVVSLSETFTFPANE